MTHKQKANQYFCDKFHCSQAVLAAPHGVNVINLSRIPRGGSPLGGGGGAAASHTPPPPLGERAVTQQEQIIRPLGITQQED